MGSEHGNTQGKGSTVHGLKRSGLGSLGSKVTDLIWRCQQSSNPWGNCSRRTEYRLHEGAWPGIRDYNRIQYPSEIPAMSISQQLRRRWHTRKTRSSWHDTFQTKHQLWFLWGTVGGNSKKWRRWIRWTGKFWETERRPWLFWWAYDRKRL